MGLWGCSFTNFVELPVKKLCGCIASPLPLLSGTHLAIFGRLSRADARRRAVVETVWDCKDDIQ